MARSAALPIRVLVEQLVNQASNEMRDRWPEEPPIGSVLRFEKAFNSDPDKCYTYVAYHAPNGKWYVTSSTYSASMRYPMKWTTLREEIGRTAKCEIATGWAEVPPSEAFDSQTMDPIEWAERHFAAKSDGDRVQVPFMEQHGNPRLQEDPRLKVESASEYQPSARSDAEAGYSDFLRTGDEVRFRYGTGWVRGTIVRETANSRFQVRVGDNQLLPPGVYGVPRDSIALADSDSDDTP